jgi:8-oxo-dGTP diphosphatase
MEEERFRLLSTVHLLLIRNSRILLLRRFNTGYEDGNYSVVAGHLNGNEEVKEAMIREAREEAGIELARGNLKVVGVMHRRAVEERIDFFFTARTWFGEIINKEPEKCDQLGWFRVDQLPDNVISYVRKAIDNSINKTHRGIWFESFGWEIDKFPSDLHSLHLE